MGGAIHKGLTCNMWSYHMPQATNGLPHHSRPINGGHPQEITVTLVAERIAEFHKLYMNLDEAEGLAQEAPLMGRL
jgi:hypothetical protein